VELVPTLRSFSDVSSLEETLEFGRAWCACLQFDDPYRVLFSYFLNELCVQKSTVAAISISVLF